MAVLTLYTILLTDYFYRHFIYTIISWNVAKTFPNITKHQKARKFWKASQNFFQHVADTRMNFCTTQFSSESAKSKKIVIPPTPFKFTINSEQTNTSFFVIPRQCFFPYPLFLRLRFPKRWWRYKEYPSEIFPWSEKTFPDKITMKHEK